MSVFTVHHNHGMSKAIIAQKGYGPVDSEGYEEVGSFKHGVDEDDSSVDDSKSLSVHGEHVFITKAKKVLEKAGVKNADKLTFEDRASNAVRHDDLTGTTDEDLPESENATDSETSSQMGGEQSAAGTNPDDKLPNGKSDKA